MRTAFVMTLKLASPAYDVQKSRGIAIGSRYRVTPTRVGAVSWAALLSFRQAGTNDAHADAEIQHAHASEACAVYAMT